MNDFKHYLIALVGVVAIIGIYNAFSRYMDSQLPPDVQVYNRCMDIPGTTEEREARIKVCFDLVQQYKESADGKRQDASGEAAETVQQEIDAEPTPRPQADEVDDSDTHSP